MSILKYLKGHGAAVVVILVLLVCQAFFDLNVPRITADIVDVGIQQSGVEDAAQLAEYQALGYDLGAMQTSYILHSGLAMLGLVAGSVVCGILVSLIASRTGAAIGKSLRERMYERVISFSDADIQRFSAASLITRATNDIQQIQTMVVMALRLIIYAPILAIGGVIQVVRTNISMGWVIGVGILAVFAVVGILMTVTMPKFKIMQKLVDRVNLVAREMLTGVSVIRAFGRQSHEQERFNEANTDLMSTQLFTNRAMSLMMPAMMLVMNGISVLIVWVGSHYVDAGQIQTGDLIAFITYAMVIISSFLIIGVLAIIIPRADVSAKRIDEVLETQPSIVDPVHPVSLANTSASTNGAGATNAAAGAKAGAATSPNAARTKPGAEIAFDHVDFAYEGSQEPALRDVTFTAPAGKVTAIVGSTGSGKSTVIKLIERFYDVSAGSVTIDGVDVRDLTQHELRANLGYVPQASFLFSGTIESNVAYGAPHASPEVIERATRIAQAADFIAEKEEGLKTPIAQGGTNVSGGQRQRLAIARALATDARAYLFDDSFSALDYKTDAQLRQALSTQMSGKTVLIVAQRIASVLHADRIIVLDEGHVVGQGTHAELMHSCEEYREIALSQLSADELGANEPAAVELTATQPNAACRGGEAR